MFFKFAKLEIFVEVVFAWDSARVQPALLRVFPRLAVPTALRRPSLAAPKADERIN